VLRTSPLKQVAHTPGALPVALVFLLPTHACVMCGCRVLRLLERAPRSIRLVADAEPLQVVYEDARFLAVSKPPGLRSAPVHRFLGGSAVNRMIGYLGAEPYLLHRC
jgi:23S rRNA-/tRNA-specific pseudouridylate synthase